MEAFLFCDEILDDFLSTLCYDMTRGVCNLTKFSQKISQILNVINDLCNNKFTGSITFYFFEGSISNKYHKEIKELLIK